MNACRLMSRALAWLCLSLGLLALLGSSAQAADNHEYLSQITEVPSTGPHGEPILFSGPLTGVEAMDFDSGELYVSTSGSTLDKFSVSGGFVSQFAQAPGLSYLYQGLAVGHSTGETEVYAGGDAYPAGSPEGAIAVFSQTGELQNVWEGADTPAGKFDCFECSGAGGVAVDSSSSLSDWAVGDVYVAAPEEGVVDVFRPGAKGKEEYTGIQLTGISPSQPFEANTRLTVTVSAFNGDVLVVNSDAVDIFKPGALAGQYEFVGNLVSPSGPYTGPPSLAIDGSDGDIYVAKGIENTVEEFDAEGVHIGQFTGKGTPAGNFTDASAVAVDPSTHRVFVGDTEKGIYVFSGNIVVPDVTTGPVSEVGVNGATLTGTVNADKAGGGTCDFLWGRTLSLEETPIPCAAPFGEGESSVQATLSGLVPDTTYHYLLEATNEHGTNPGQGSQDQEFTTLGPGIHEEWTVNATSSSVTLAAKLDPDNSATSYYFEYGTGTSYGATVPLPPGAFAGSGKGDVEVSQHVQSLEPATTYHYRVVALSEMAPGEVREFDGPDHAFVTQTLGVTVTLPDNRAWEMVSPPQKQGASIEPSFAEGIFQAAAQGRAFSYIASAPTEANPQGYAGFVQLMSARGPEGWRSRDLTIPHPVATSTPVGAGMEYRYFSNDLSRAAVQPFGSFEPSLSVQASEPTAYLHTNGIGDDVSQPCEVSCYTPLVTGKAGYANVPPGTVFGKEKEGKCGQVYCGPEFVAASPDLSHVLIQSSVSLSEASGGNGGLYEWAAGKLTPIAGDQSHVFRRNSISNDGSLVFGGSEDSHLYVTDTQTGKTAQLDAVQGGSGSGPVSALFQIASNDGSVVFFTDGQRLTPGAGAREGTDDLYECEITVVAGQPQCALTDITPPNGAESAGVVGTVIGASEDGSYVYFVASGVSAEGAIPGSCNRGNEATCNLYMRHAGVTTLVAILSGEDYPTWNGKVNEEPNLRGLTGRVSPNGRWLAFMSQQDLTGYDTRDAVTGEPSEEVYLYDAVRRRLVCASCNPTGARPKAATFDDKAGSIFVGADEGWEGQPLAGVIPGWVSMTTSASLYQPRYLTDSGRLLFNSNDALVPQDVNGNEDIYEYEQPSVGDCTVASATYSARSEGCVGLISSGTATGESALLDADESGSEVFFMTTAKLSNADFDSSFDVYDAHECTEASPCVPQPPSSPPACTTGDSCKPAPTPQPSIFGSPSSATFSGAGNVIPATSSGTASRQRGLSPAQKLVRALKECRRKTQGKRRAACIRRAKARNVRGRRRVVAPGKRKTAKRSGR